MKITIGHLYPDLLNLYGDRGNIQCLMKRCQWRGIEAETVCYEINDKIDFSGLDIVLLGGGSDREQMLVCNRLKTIREDFRNYVEDNGVVIAICGGYQLLGNYYATAEGKIEGLGLIDLDTDRGTDYRLIDNIVLESELVSMPVVGFENHGGQTKNVEHPFGKVLIGHGNIHKGDYEGFMNDQVLATYMHGPLLPKNPEIADKIIQRALKKRYGEVTLEPLNDEIEHKAKEVMLKRLHVQ